MKPNSTPGLVFLAALALCLPACENPAASHDDDTPRTITYDGNGNDSGSVPVDQNAYAPGNGFLYTEGGTFIMGRKDLTLYAKGVIPPGTALWARSVASGSGDSGFTCVTTDYSGCLFAVGHQYGSSAYTYGTVCAAEANAVIVKYVR